MSELVRVLMKRDGLTREEAEELVAGVREQISEADSMWKAEDIILDELGLEMDYIFDII